MKNLFQTMLLIAIFALWGHAHAYDVVFDIDISQVSKADHISLDGSAYSMIGDQKTNIDLQTLGLKPPTQRSISGEEWTLDWLGENLENLILSTGLDPNLVEVELDLKKHKLRCRGRHNPECVGEISLRLTVRRL